MSELPTPVVVYPAPAGVTWRVYNVWRAPPAQRSVVVGELSLARSLRLHFDLKAPATASCTLDGRRGGAASITELAQDLVLYRWNPYANAYVVMFRGPIGHSEDKLDATSHDVELQAADYRAMLARRPVGGPLTYTNVDQFEIASGLIQGAPAIDIATPPYNLGLNQAGLLNPDGSSLASTGVNRDRSYIGSEKTADMLDNLAAVIDGFDWGAEPLDPVYTPLGFAAQPYVWYPQRGVAKSFVADYGGTVAGVTRSVDSTQFTNWVRNDGTKDQATGDPLFAVAAGDVITNPQLHAEGWWPRMISNPSTSDPTTLQEQAAGELALDSVLVPSYALELVAGTWNWKSDAWLGDSVAVRVYSGRLQVDTRVRIMQIDVAVDDNGVETITLTVARTVPTLGDLLIDQRGELDALARR